MRVANQFALLGGEATPRDELAVGETTVVHLLNKTVEVIFMASTKTPLTRSSRVNGVRST